MTGQELAHHRRPFRPLKPHGRCDAFAPGHAIAPEMTTRQDCAFSMIRGWSLETPAESVKCCVDGHRACGDGRFRNRRSLPAIVRKLTSPFGGDEP